jgi:alkylation response protein AidB-like acyl-CoA dehydrogenase
MDFRLDDEQLALQKTVDDFARAHFGLAQIGRRDGHALDRAGWEEMAGLGIFELLASDPDEAPSFGPVGAAIVMEQLGAHLAAGPILWSVLAASLIEGVASGERVAAGIDVTCPSDALIVEHPDDLDVLLVLEADAVFVCERGALPSIEPLAPLDPLTPVGRLSTRPIGTQVGGKDEAARLRLLGQTLSAASLTGIASAALTIARDHALGRHQFGVPIGSFQAIKHLLADMFVRTSLARSATYAAAAGLDDPSGAIELSAATAKLLAGEAAIDNARAAIQVHGGMGFTWEMPPHHLLKRAWVLENSFGTTTAHAYAIAATVEREAS